MRIEAMLWLFWISAIGLWLAMVAYGIPDIE